MRYLKHAYNSPVYFFPRPLPFALTESLAQAMMILERNVVNEYRPKRGNEGELEFNNYKFSPNKNIMKSITSLPLLEFVILVHLYFLSTNMPSRFNHPKKSQLQLTPPSPLPYPRNTR